VIYAATDIIGYFGFTQLADLSF